MKICMIHDLDTGFLAATLKPAFEALGHECVVMQTVKTYLEGDESTHIDYLMSEMSNEDIPLLEEEFKDTDFFIVRSITDFTLRVTNVLKYINNTNMIFKVHGSDLKITGEPYSMKAWRLDWYGKEPIVCGPRDYNLAALYKGHTITHIERPMNFDLIPNKRKKGTYALTTPTNFGNKGTDVLIDVWNKAIDNKEIDIPLKVVSGVSREEALKEKARSSYFIDRAAGWGSPYGMNSVEAILLRIPVFSQYSVWDIAMCPELEYLVYNIDENTVIDVIKDYKEDKKRLNKAYRYVKDMHDPIKIAGQYANLGKAIISDTI